MNSILIEWETLSTCESTNTCCCLEKPSSELNILINGYEKHEETSFKLMDNEIQIRNWQLSLSLQLS